MNDHDPPPSGTEKDSSSTTPPPSAPKQPAGSGKASAATAAKASRIKKPEGPEKPAAGKTTAPKPGDGNKRWRLAVAIAIPVLMIAAFLVARSAKDEPTPTAAEDPLVEYCATLVERDSVPLPDPSQASSEEVKETVPVLAGRMVLLTEKLITVAPKDAKAELEKQREAYRALVVSRDPAGFRSTEITESRKRVSDVDVSSCKLGTVRLNATDDGYSDVPGTVKRGKTSFEMRSVGNEGHEMVLFRRKEEFPGDFIRILRAGKENEEATRLSSAYAAPGYSGTLVTDLAGGDYALVCFVKSGSEPHWENGMIAKFTVR